MDLDSGPCWAQDWEPLDPKSGYVGSSLAPNCLQERPKRLQESSKRLPRGPKRLQEALQEASRRPSGCQDASKSSTRGSRNGLGMILGTIWKHFLQMLDCYASRLAARCQQDGGRRHGPPQTTTLSRPARNRSTSRFELGQVRRRDFASKTGAID